MKFNQKQNGAKRLEMAPSLQQTYQPLSQQQLCLMQVTSGLHPDNIWAKQHQDKKKNVKPSLSSQLTDLFCDLLTMVSASALLSGQGQTIFLKLKLTVFSVSSLLKYTLANWLIGCRNKLLTHSFQPFNMLKLSNLPISTNTHTVFGLVFKYD